MKRAVVILFVCLLCALAGCGPKPEEMNEQEQRVYDALVRMAQADPSIESIVIDGIDTTFLPEHVNIDVQLTYTKGGTKTTVTGRLMLQSGSLYLDPNESYSAMGENNECMKILNINYALEQYLNHR